MAMVGWWLALEYGGLSSLVQDAGYKYHKPFQIAVAVLRQPLINNRTMDIEKTNFSINHIPDNDAAYFSLLEGTINSIDQYATMAITKGPKGYYFRLCPSSSKYINLLIEQLTAMNKYMGIMLNFSKSMKSTGAISFSVPIFA